MKIAIPIIIFLVNIAFGVVTLLFLLLAMNGYSESDATYGLATFVLLAIATALSMSLAGFLLSRLLERRDFKSSISALIAIPSFSVVGAVLIIAAAAIGVGVAEYVRVNY